MALTVSICDSAPCKMVLSYQGIAMTTPVERMRNLVQAGAFLKEMRANESLPAQIRDEAARLLRHYPTVGELQMLARSCDMLAIEFDPDWIRGNPLGAHT